jgi:hypothetical protein
VRIISILAASMLFAACSSTTLIRVSDPDAKIYVDGEYRGKGFISYSDSKIVGSVTDIRLEKPGCETLNLRLHRNEEIEPAALIGGIFLVPLLWVQRYKPEHNYEFNCESRKR